MGRVEFNGHPTYGPTFCQRACATNTETPAQSRIDTTHAPCVLAHGLEAVQLSGGSVGNHDSMIARSACRRVATCMCLDTYRTRTSVMSKYGPDSVLSGGTERGMPSNDRAAYSHAAVGIQLACLTLRL